MHLKMNPRRGSSTSGAQQSIHAWGTCNFATVLIVLSAVLLNSESMLGAELRNGTRLGPASTDVHIALTLDLERTLGPDTCSTMTLSWIREKSEDQVFAGWTQQMNGYSVRGAMGRSLAIRDRVTGLWTVTYRAFRYSTPEEIPAPVLNKDSALQVARMGHPSRDWLQPTLQLAPGKDGEPTLCWVNSGVSTIPGHHSNLRVDVDAQSGQVLAVEEQICEIDVPGTASVFRTEGTAPQSPGTTISFPLSGAQVSGGGVSTFTAADGSFLLSNATGSNFTVLAGLQGQWGSVSSDSSPDATASATADPAGVDLVINSGQVIAETAQGNAFHYMEEAFRFFVDAPGGFPAMATPVTATTGMAGSCNAYYDPALTMLRFLQSGAGCVDSAYSSVVLHEFGHHIVNSLGLAQQSFGEGYGDSLAVVYLGEGIVGRDFSGPGTFVRDIVAANVQIPCSSGIHYCGQALAGFWFDLRQTMVTQLGEAAGSEFIRDLFVDWSSLTIGASASQPFHYDMLIEVLTVNDDDFDVGNGTPQFDEICAAASDHGVVSPELLTILLGLDLGPGATVPPAASTPIRVLVEEILATPLPNGSMVIYRFEGAPFQAFLLTETSPGVYEGNFPALDCLDSLEWFVSVQDDANQTTTLPPDADLGVYYSTVVATDLITVVEEPFSADPGWSIAEPSDTATAGRWEWGDPYASAAQASGGVPFTGGDLTCYVTGLGGIGQTQGAHDVDGGDTTLTSVAYPLSNTGLHRVSYWRWFSNATSITTPDDSLFVYKSLDEGLTWVEVEEVGRGDPEALGGWYKNSFWIAEGTSPSGTVMLRFHVGDTGFGNVVEAGVDLIEIFNLSCSTTPPPPVENDFIRGDCNIDGNRDLSDAIQMLEVMFGNAGSFQCEDACDMDDGGQVNLGDVIQILNELFLGFPGGPINCGADVTSDSIGCLNGLICP
jgi:hypothetical protein